MARRDVDTSVLSGGLWNTSLHLMTEERASVRRRRLNNASALSR